MDTLRVGVVGYCPPSQFDEEEALRLLRDAYDQIAHEYSATGFTIVSGLCNVGIPKLAYEEAEHRDWRTAGIACRKAFAHEWFPVSEEPRIVGTDWGEESDAFLESIDILVRVGGGPQSLLEAQRMKERLKPVYEFELEKLA